MKFPRLARKPTVSIVIFLALLASHVRASIIIERGTDPDECAAAQEASTNDGPTSDKSAGIGMEFEAGMLWFFSKTMQDRDDTWKLKGKLIGGRKGTNWELTGDTMLDEGLLNGEYILDGRAIKLGSGALAEAADACAKDLVSRPGHCEMLVCATGADSLDNKGPSS